MTRADDTALGEVSSAEIVRPLPSRDHAGGPIQLENEL
jgi:hypothetical protein